MDGKAIRYVRITELGIREQGNGFGREISAGNNREAYMGGS